ncbi:MAG: efflux RND transporter periplasmic adaptor subunit [Vicinamibacteria bacterium]|nr:efflux RND transporter periplasmic adaptor subunit [Vicinamibacteria bacterium]
MTDSQKDLSGLRIDRETQPKAARFPWLKALVAAMVVIVVAALVYGALLARSPIDVDVTEARVASGASTTVLNASGYVTPRRRATVAAEITGRVTAMLVEEGMKVESGQVLARLDDAELRAQLGVAQSERDVALKSAAEIEASLSEAQRALRRNREIAASGLVSDQELERSETETKVLAARLELSRQQVEAAARRIEQAEHNLDNCTVRAPFAGVAVSKDAQVGEIVSPISAGGGFTRTGISTIVDMESLEIEVDVNEAYIARVQPGQSVEATLDAYPDWKIPARVRTTIPTADRQKATVKVRIAFDALDPRILPDMGVKVAFLESTQEKGMAVVPIALVPLDAVRKDKGANVIFVVKDDRLERRAVQVGGPIGADAQIQAGLQAGEIVVVRGPEDLENGQRVRMRNKAP